MDTKDVKSIVIINNNYPPFTAITGESAHDLASFLIKNNVKVSIVTTDTKYTGQSRSIEDGAVVYRYRDYYKGKQNTLRLMYSFYNSFRLVLHAKKLKADKVILMTDPPFLSFFGSLLLRKSSWILWGMDIYPDAFVAARLTSKNNFVYKLLYKVVYNNPPSLIIALGEKQASFLYNSYKNKLKDSVIIPCGVYSQENVHNIPEWADSNKIVLGYCGNIGNAHSVEFVKEAIIQSEKSEKFKFILSVYGENASKLIDFAKNFLHVTILPFVKRENLKYIDIHLVSLKKEWTHICVPSKAVTAICTGSLILYSGSKDSDTWNFFNKASWFIDENNIEADVLTFFNELNTESINKRKALTKTITEKLSNQLLVGYNDVLDFIKN